MNISVVGSKGLAKELGKKGTSSDITLYNTSFQGNYYTFAEPEKYPEKIQTLFQSLNMSQFVILYITKELPKNILGECIIALDLLKINGILVLDGIEESEIKPFLKETFLEDFPIVENEKVLEFLSKNNIGAPTNSEMGAKIKIQNSTPKVLIDHSFLVKSVGTVALGTVISGTIKKYDKLSIYPSKKEILIKSIQIHDKAFEEACPFERVGLCIKGAEASELKRGCIISNDIDCVKEISVSLVKNKFFNGEHGKFMCIAGLQYVPCKFEDEKIIFENEIAFDGEPLILLTPEKKMRIFGVCEKK
ncbi:MAG: hypothetical protein ISS95_01305 [Candidatus Aenigmarchaeota archaeon]|nr:hypothetical protein [Candidatus Aenigmarchaeota archaeon]